MQKVETLLLNIINDKLRESYYNNQYLFVIYFRMGASALLILLKFNFEHRQETSY